MNDLDLRQLLPRFVTVLGLAAGLGAIWLHIAQTNFPVDMIIYREGARAFFSGGEVYSQPMYAGDLALPFIYPPFGALVLAPLTPSFISDDMAGNIMIVISDVLLLACLYYIFKHLLPKAGQWERWAVIVVAWVVGMMIEPVVLNQGFAQINMVIMGLVFLDLVPRKRRLPRGFWIGIAAAIKITPLAMCLVFLLRKEFRAIFVTAASAVGATLVAAAVRWDATVEYFSTTLLGMNSGNEFGVDSSYQSNSSIKGVLMRFAESQEQLDTHSSLVNILWLILSLTTIGLGGWLMWALLRREMVLDAILVNSLIMLLISPVSWSHHWVWLALILPVATWRIFTLFRNNDTALSAIVALWAVLVLTNPPKWWFGDAIQVFELPIWQKVLVSDFVWLAIATMVALAVALRTVPRAQPEAVLGKRIDSGSEPPRSDNASYA
ncbi:glycosyltransferase family 87 protein [Corynebacterium breve]|uniref:Glycosyltransferase family 87 protein n=1 Tax=Corynebacterium breve TaxID=3049799 RepID=A0ABY8VM89_9CORY|nr:glycosyltransferase family 87 protein [Corynebacterium breve]WIM68675.1 glycosyltransferase family 87 protein [Corynebacterium breve]